MRRGRTTLFATSGLAARLSDEGGVVMSETQQEALEAAVYEALRAPSIFNTQPWIWRIDETALELSADRSRQLEPIDPQGNLLLMSCGAALHHALVALAAAGWAIDVDRLRPSAGGEVLARICLVGRREPDQAAVMLQKAIARRRTDRRPFADQPVPADVVDIMTAAAESGDMKLHRVRYDQMPMLAIAVAAAGDDEMGRYRYRNLLMRWTNRPEWSKDGVPPATAVQRVPRRVPVREFAMFPQEGMTVTPGGDRGAAYFVLHGPGHEPLDWLRAGEALSAVLLTAVSFGLAVAPITDVLEVEHPRELVRGLLGDSSEPYAVVRCGYPIDPTELPEVPRRAADEVLRRRMVAAEHDLVDSVPEVAGRSILVAVLDRDGRIVHFNRACESTTGYSLADVEGRLVSELFLPPEDIEYAAAFGEGAASAEEYPLPNSFVCTWIDREEKRHHIAWSNDALVDGPDGTRVIAIGIDITDRRAAKAELREAQERFRLAFDNAPIGMCLVRLDGRFVQVNRALCEILGRSEPELLRLGVTEVTHLGDLRTTLQAIANVGTGQAHAYHDEIRFLHADGRIVWALMSVSPVCRDSGEPLYYLIQIQDITARRAAEERLAQQALHDPLTGLLNRAALMEQVQLELNRGHHRDGLTGILCADLDGFKVINETLGSFVGDQVLREVAGRLQSGVGSSGTVARFGGDKFIILCRDLPNECELLNLARRLADSVSAPMIVDRREIVVTISVGLATDESGDLNADRVVRNADIAMYRAKAGGRNECRIFEEPFRQYFLDCARIEDALRLGLRDDHFVLHFQPIVDLKTHRVVAVESLLRLNNPKLGLMMPGTFIEIAEESGLIVPIGAWVLEHACRELANWRNENDRTYDRLNDSGQCVASAGG